MIDGARARDHVSFGMRMRSEQLEGARGGGVWTLAGWRKVNGLYRKIWEDTFPNKTPDVSLAYQLDVALLAGSAISSWFIGLTNATPVGAAGDTMASHAGWTENVAYSEAARQAWTKTRTGLSVSNSASLAVFSINAAGQTIGGAFITSDSTKSGTAGTLFCIGANSGGNRSPNSGDQITASYSYALASTN